MYEEKLRVSPGLSLGTDLYFYALDYNASIEAQFDNPDHD